MASGFLGRALLAASTQTLLYTVPAATLAVVNIRIANQNSTSVNVRVAITGGSTPTPQDFITYDFNVDGNSILEETGFVCSAAERVYVFASATNVSVRVHGYEEAA